VATKPQLDKLEDVQRERSSPLLRPNTSASSPGRPSPYRTAGDEQATRGKSPSHQLPIGAPSRPNDLADGSRAGLV